MHKIFKTVIVGAEGSDNVGINTNFKSTMGYDASTDTINIKVESAKKVEMDRSEDLLPTIFELCDEVAITRESLNQLQDNGAWLVDFDVATKKIVTTDVLDWFATANPGKSDFHINVNEEITKRYSPNLLPLAYIKNYDKAADGFSQAVVLFYTADTKVDATDTVITCDAELVTTKQYKEYIQANVMPVFTFDVLDSNGDAVTATLTKTDKNRYRTSLPSGNYTVDVTCTKVDFAETANTYTITLVNGVANKSRLVLANGSSPINLDLSGLVTGEYSKLKINAGKFISYAELWIDIA